MKLSLLYFFSLYMTSPGLLSPSPVSFNIVGLLFNHLFVFFEFIVSYKLFNHLFVFFEFLVSYKLFIILVISLYMLYLVPVPCPVFVLCLCGLFANDSCCWVVWGLRSLNAAFPCWSCLSYL
jgi:hypothetical protein